MKIITTCHSNKPILSIYQINNGYIIVDITVKSGCDIGWVFAPTWEMVNSFKSGKMTENEFTLNYFSLVNNRWNKILPSRIANMQDMKMILTCYCPIGQFCHRYLAAKFLTQKGARYYGEYNRC